MQFRFLAFRPAVPDLRNHLTSFVIYVVIVSWIVGMGRYWDHPKAYAWQYAGLGSVAYIFVLSVILYVLIWPLRPKHWTYPAVLVFVGLTSLPGLLYAIPVERFMSLERAQAVNGWFLAIVAVWRVALYVRFLMVSRVPSFGLFSAILLPLSAIVATLALLNLEHVVFNIMAGNTAENSSPNDSAYGIVLLLGFLSIWALPISFMMHVSAIFAAQFQRRRERASSTGEE